jgi:hypothetical protein
VQKLIKNCPPDVAPNVQNSNCAMNMRLRQCSAKIVFVLCVKSI